MQFKFKTVKGAKGAVEAMKEWGVDSTRIGCSVSVYTDAPFPGPSPKDIEDLQDQLGQFGVIRWPTQQEVKTGIQLLQAVARCASVLEGNTGPLVADEYPEFTSGMVVRSDDFDTLKEALKALGEIYPEFAE